MDKTKFDRYNAFALSTIYSEPEEGNFHTGLIPQVMDAFLPEFDLQKDARILDIGCGQGVFIREANKRGYCRVTGITASKEDFDMCCLSGHQVLWSDFSDITMTDETADFIWCRHALEHSPYPLFTLLEFNRLLSPNGKIYIEVPAPGCDRVHENNPNHYSILGPQMWASLLNKTGFEVMFVKDVQLSLNIDGQQVKETYLCIGAAKNGTPAV